MKKLTLLALSLATFISACSDSDSKINGIEVDYTSHSLALSKATSCDDFRSHILDSLAMAVAQERFYRYMGPIADAEYMPNYDVDGASKDDGGSAEKPAGEYTTTNIQEAGVDELDSVKNDGSYMYAIRGGEIHISKIWPVADMKEVATISHKDEKDFSWFNPAGLFLTDDKKLIEISNNYTWYGDDEDSWFGHYTATVGVSVYDVSNPETPKLVKKHVVDGQLVDARLIDNRLHMVSSANPAYEWYDIYKLAQEDIPGVPRLIDPREDDDFDFSEWDEDEREAFYDEEYDFYMNSGKNIEKYLPVIRAWLDKKYPNVDMIKMPNYYNGEDARPAVSCTDLYIPSVASRDDGFLLVSEFSGSNYENYHASAIADGGWTVYASKKNLYVASTSSNWWSQCDWDDEIECERYTHIHHFNLGESDASVKYINSAEINGYANDSFYYSEYNDHLRVVSSDFSWWNGAGKGQTLSILDIKSPNIMKLTGSLEGFGENERIYSARFVGDRGYVVTFRNTDPLFVFDLSDPTAPKELGKLQINGYSSYIHPVGENHLLTIGEDGDETGRLNGMKLDLYDVTDPAHPVLKYTTKINDEYYDYDENSESGSYGWSDALYNHHAFQYHEASGLLAVPVVINKWSYSRDEDGHDWNYDEFSGVFVYRVKPDMPFEFVGGIDHSDLVPEQNDYWWTYVDRSRFYFKDKGVYDKNAYVYTMSNYGIKASNANSPDETVGMIKYN